MPDLVTGGTLLKYHVSAGRTGVLLLLVSPVCWNNRLVYGSPRPEEETAGANAYRIFTNGTQETFVGLPVLLDQPLRLWEGDRANEMNQ